MRMHTICKASPPIQQLEMAFDCLHGWTHLCRCHVMEHESFENEAVASVMNQHFVNVKVDREERPDVDKVYVRSPQSMLPHRYTMFW